MKEQQFDIEELTNLLDGGKEFTKQRRDLVKFLLKDPDLKTTVPWERMSYVERYEESLRKSCIAVRKFELFNSNTDAVDPRSLFSVLASLVFPVVLEDGVPFVVHLAMFIPAILSQGTIQQQSYWIARAWNFQILGTYAQTELGHGTFIRGLETTARYDPDSEEFILNSPTLTSYKWWPGGLGHTANYAIVMAQLFTLGKSHGIHSFIVQLRDEETHMPLRGIHVGEIGCKMGNNSVNNGFLGLNNVRIPRNHMLMQHATVSKDGTYTKNTTQKLTYSTMVFMRATVVKDVAANFLAQAVTIATRRHFDRIPSGSESRVHQLYILPHISNSLAMTLSSRWLWSVYQDVFESGDEADINKLPELHAMACCLKAVCSSDSAQAIEECRKVCGGYDSTENSRLQKLYALVTSAETYEGENTVLLLQTARYLIKCYANKEISDTTKYLAKRFDNTPWENNMDRIVEAFYQVAQGRIKETSQKMADKLEAGLEAEHVWNECSIHLIKCAEIHCRAYISEKFYSTIQKVQLSDPLRGILMTLCELHGLYWISKNLGSFLTYSCIEAKDVESIESRQRELMDAVRPHAWSLTEAFDFDPDVLPSSVDGNNAEEMNDFKNLLRTKL